MPEYLSIEIYSSYPEKILSPFLDDVRQMLEDLGYAGKDVECWLAQIAWEPDESGFSSSLEPSAMLEKVVVNDHTLITKPIVNGWTQETISQLQRAWVSLTLACETQTERQNLDTVDSFATNYSQQHQYQPGVGKAVWRIMRQCADLFPQSLVYFTNEAQTSQPWNALLTSQKEIWEFEAALIPRSFIAHFVPIPEQFAHIHLPGGVGFARTSCWSILPWEE